MPNFIIKSPSYPTVSKRGSEPSIDLKTLSLSCTFLTDCDTTRYLKESPEEVLQESTIQLQYMVANTEQLSADFESLKFNLVRLLDNHIPDPPSCKKQLNTLLRTSDHKLCVANHTFHQLIVLLERLITKQLQLEQDMENWADDLCCRGNSSFTKLTEEAIDKMKKYNDIGA